METVWKSAVADSVNFLNRQSVQLAVMSAFNIYGLVQISQLG